MRLPRTAHTERPWRVHEFTRDFRVEDVWSFRTPGAGPDDFPAMLEALRTGGGFAEQSPAVRFLFAVRWKLGALFGWDAPEDGVGKRVRSLRDRLPDDLRGTVDGSETGDTPFDSVYKLDDEAVNELANKTVHTLMHLGWVPTGSGGHELRMAVLVKPNGRLGRLYMALIAPFRNLVVYPALTRQWERAWRNRTAGAPGAVTAEVGPHEVPESVRALSNLPAIDYVDRFTLSTDADATPEQWARAMFGDVPTLAERFIWRGLLGLRLARGRSPHTVAGWRIAERGKDWILLEAASWFMSDNLLVQTAEGRVSLSTFLRYDRLLGRAIWSPLSAVHRRLAPGLLRDATAKLRAT
ncbi:DUF2867 domain-containing protein [Actinomadura sediminis]|uniref:DUF2867 domain-containing protein n=1 Tax=Actinomadura sediminis TaxID=1038904 RepID=A0ABW3EKC6_9ACTN